MRKIVAFVLDPPIDVVLFRSLCDEIFLEHVLEMTANDKGFLNLDDLQISQMKIMQSHLHANGTTMTAVIGYKEDAILNQALHIAQQSARSSISHIADIMLLESIHGGKTVYAMLNEQMQRITHETILTAKAFIEHGCNAIAASEHLYIHRNTFAYRLNKFIDQTQLDIRDFHLARLFQLWSILNSTKK
jgi:sugar diacid utilization regulator